MRQRGYASVNLKSFRLPGSASLNLDFKYPRRCNDNFNPIDYNQWRLPTICRRLNYTIWNI